MSLQRIQEMNILIEPDAAALFEGMHPTAQSRAIERLISLQTKPMLLDAVQMRRLLLPEAKLIKRIERPTEFSVHDLSAAWSSRFAALQQLLLKRPEMTGTVSIAAAGGRCTIVGQVKKGKCTELEDPTGSVEIITDKQLLSDDVIAATGRAENGAFKAEEIFFPDVPLRETTNCSGTLGIGMEGDFIIKPDGTAWWDVGGLIIMVHKADWNALADQLGVPASQVPVELLTRRHLAAAPWDLVEQVPDILIALGIAETATSYKGTAVIGVQEKALIDLATRKVLA